MDNYQPGILQAVPEQAVYLTFNRSNSSSPQKVTEALDAIEPEDDVIGIGQALVDQYGRGIPGHRTMPDFSTGKFNLTPTPADLWCWLRGNDRGDLLHRSRGITGRLSAAFDLVASVDAFRYAGGRDLTGHEDGTENPRDEAAIDAAIRSSDDQAIHGSSFVVAQQWQHDLDVFETFSDEQQDNIIGRRRSGLD